MQEDKDFSLPQREYVIPNQHKYAVNDKVRNINPAAWNAYYRLDGVIIQQLPFGTTYPAYDVKYADGKMVTNSERSLERIGENSESTTK
jgi:hypothetical protein